MTASAYRPVGPWVLMLLGLAFLALGGVLLRVALHPDAPLGVALWAGVGAVFGGFSGLAAILHYFEILCRPRAERLADLWIEDTLDRAASISRESDDERNAA